MEGAITYPAVAQIIALLITGAGALFGVWAYIDRQIKSTAADCTAKIDAVAATKSARLDALEKELSEYKLHVSEKFIKADQLEKMETRLMATEARTLAALEQLTKRIDSLISEINSTPASRSRRTTQS